MNKILNLKQILKDKFNIAVFVSIFVLLALIAIFWILSVVIKPHIRFFEVVGGLESASLTNQKIKVFFSSPMLKENTEDFIEVTPKTPFKTAWSNNNLFIIFDINLQSETNYKITFSNDLKDLYSQSLSNATIEFKTKPQEFLFIKKDDISKTLTKSNLNFELEDIYKDANLEIFDATSDYAVVVTLNSNKTNALKIINLITKEVEVISVKDKLIPDVAASPTFNEFAYISQSTIVRDTYAQALEDTSIVIYNLDTKEQKVINFNTPGEGVTNIEYSPDGNSILYKTSQSYYQLMSISNPDNNIWLGRFLSDGGFNFDGSKISFVEFDPVNAWTSNQYIVELNSDRDSKNLTDGVVPVLDPEYFNTQNSILYSKKYLEQEGTKGIYQIIQNNDTDSKVIVTDQTRSLELPKLSFDDKFILIEGYKATDLLAFNNSRTFGFQTKPATSDILLFDMQKNELIDPQIRGYNVVWLR